MAFDDFYKTHGHFLLARLLCPQKASLMNCQMSLTQMLSEGTYEGNHFSDLGAVMSSWKIEKSRAQQVLYGFAELMVLICSTCFYHCQE